MTGRRAQTGEGEDHVHDGLVEQRPRRHALRSLLGWAMVLAGLALAMGTGLDAVRGQDLPEEDQLAHGAEIYAASCAACHGATGEGGPGEPGEVTAGPPVRGTSLALNDMLLRTGRMPIIDRTVGVCGGEQIDTDEEREAVLAWMNERLDLTGDIPEVGEGSVSRGHELYTRNCASCHGSAGEGGVSGDGTLVLGLANTDPVATVEAIRTGPIGMPSFAEATISDDDADDIAAFVQQRLVEPERTPAGLTELGRPAMWLLSALLLVVAAGTVLLTAKGPRVPRRLVSPDDEPATGGSPGTDGDAKSTGP